MEFRDVNNIITDMFLDEYTQSSIIGWTRFIEKKDIGIVYNNTHSAHNIYKVVNEKKWLLTKIKYGI